ncbi:MAG TPA: hypothetical protein PLW99_02340 [Candidatus Paceibacterota bacterium]|nr:hypothetical protein [Candidatus Paceibacterota bacterium]
MLFALNTVDGELAIAANSVLLVASTPNKNISPPLDIVGKGAGTPTAVVPKGETTFTIELATMAGTELSIVTLVNEAAVVVEELALDDSWFVDDVLLVCVEVVLTILVFVRDVEAVVVLAVGGVKRP